MEESTDEVIVMKNQIMPDEIARISFLANKCLTRVQQDSATEALLAARKATEGMLYNVAQQKKYITDMKIRSLEDYLKIFHGKQDCLPQHVYLHIQTIQKFSNPMLHFQAIDYEYDSITLQNCLNALASIILWYIDQFPGRNTKCLHDVSSTLITAVPIANQVTSLESSDYQQQVKPHDAIHRVIQKADAENINSMLYLAKLHTRGYAGVERNVHKAIALYERAIVVASDANKKALALNELSSIYYRNHNYTQSFEYALQAAKAGDLHAMVHLAFLYFEGIGTIQDYGEAEKWYIAAIQTNNPYASIAYHDLCRLHLHKSNNSEIKRYLLEGASRHHVKCCYQMGVFYSTGAHGFPKDFQQARDWLELAADEGNAEAMYELGRLFYLGDTNNLYTDYDEAMTWFQRASDAGHTGATYHIGYFYEFGFAGKNDYSQAKEYYLAAANKGDLYSQYHYGHLSLLETNQMYPDYQLAKEYLEKAAQQGYARAYCVLAEMEYLGLGQTPRLSKARSLFNEAKIRGDIWPDIILDALS